MKAQYQVYDEQSSQLEPKQYIPVMTIILVIINVLVFFYVEATGGSEDISHMKEMGAMYQPAFFAGEYYRLVTHFFLHFGIEHLGNNMISLLVMGYAIEGCIGKIRIVFLYFFSGILAGVTSIVYNVNIAEREIVSAGASGAIYGLMGALLTLMIFRRKAKYVSEIPRFLLYIAISVYAGMQDASIDNAAHIGGLVCGFIVCVCMVVMMSIKERRG